jgi:hypothetical protein
VLLVCQNIATPGLDIFDLPEFHQQQIIQRFEIKLHVFDRNPIFYLYDDGVKPALQLRPQA